MANKKLRALSEQLRLIKLKDKRLQAKMHELIFRHEMYKSIIHGLERERKDLKKKGGLRE